MKNVNLNVQPSYGSQCIFYHHSSVSHFIYSTVSSLLMGSG